MRLLLPHRNFLALLIAVTFFFMSSSVSFAPTKLMSDSELSDTDAQSFLNITQWNGVTGCTAQGCTGSTTVIHLDLGVNISINAHGDSQSMGYYQNAAGNTGWDYDVQDFYFGGTDKSTDPLKLNGIFLELGFDNITTAATRTLNYIDVGSMSVSGPFTGTLTKLNSLVLNNGATGQNGGVMYRQTAAGRRTVRFNNTVMSFLFANKYTYVPYSGGSTNNLNGIFQKIPSYNADLSNMQSNGTGW
jgi:hypothetical protein